MTDREQYKPGPASGAQVREDGEKPTLILVRELHHSPEKVWQALTDPAQLREWAPFDADKNLGTVGTTAKLTTVGAPTPHVSETRVTRADAPKALEYNWGDHDIRWELEAFGGGTRLTLWTNIRHRPNLEKPRGHNCCSSPVRLALARTLRFLAMWRVRDNLWTMSVRIRFQVPRHPVCRTSPAGYIPV